MKSSKGILTSKTIGKSIYPIRVFGYLLTAISIFLVNGAELSTYDVWVWFILAIFFVYPHIAFIRCVRSGSSVTEINHLLFDMFVLGMFSALVNFNPIITLPYLISNSACNYAVRGIKHVIKGVSPKSMVVCPHY